MSENEDLRAEYAAAVLAFNAASAVLIVHFAADTVPTAEDMAAEEESRAAVVAVRQLLWPTRE